MFCGLCRPQRQVAAAGASPAGPQPQPVESPPAQPQVMMRSMSEQRILQLEAAESSSFSRSQSMPSLTLLEASRRRLLAMKEQVRCHREAGGGWRLQHQQFKVIVMHDTCWKVHHALAVRRRRQSRRSSRLPSMLPPLRRLCTLTWRRLRMATQGECPS